MDLWFFPSFLLNFGGCVLYIVPCYTRDFTVHLLSPVLHFLTLLLQSLTYPCSTALCLGTAVTVAVVDDIDLVWTGGLAVVANGDLVQPLAW